ncbi:MAG: hypothetical protein JWQ90_4250 [Hydrocarboniphaga sp.]|uniref:hypothetical protein n=1 Tax=Hydrocarboniphaga sp. TaxID=2033016 RepID=UPI00260570C1|nr:hypothetical protein [Hydrocarboniphaga sp.]MDB5971800.1 hypothetical protein [Hydrocarboniphaga sp.]
MRAGVFMAVGIIATSAPAFAADPDSTSATPDAATTRSVVIPPEPEPEPGGLVFDVPLPQQRSLRENAPKFDRLLQGLPDLETHGVPFKKGWTEAIVDSFNSQWKDGPPPCKPNQCVGADQVGQRLQQLDTDYGPQDDWTWTPPSRSAGEGE